MARRPNRNNGHAFNANSWAAKKCTLYNNTTKKTLTAQFNPTTVPYGRSVTYSEMVSPGMNYPLTQYNHGEAISFEIELFYYDKPYTGKIKKAREFLQDLLPPEKNKKPKKKVLGKKKVYIPPTFKFVYGYMSKTLVLTGLDINDDWLDEKGRPIMTTFKLSVRQV